MKDLQQEPLDAKIIRDLPFLGLSDGKLIEKKSTNRDKKLLNENDIA